jgi:arylsulfatase A-like enzyme
MRRFLTLGAAVSAAASCGPPPRTVSLLDPGVLAEGDVAGRDLQWIEGARGELVRIDDVVRRTLPASPPSRLRFVVDVPREARLHLACGIPPGSQGRPGVEFVVKVREGGRESVVLSTLVDPLNHEEHHRWVDVEADLSRYAGSRRELLLETRGFDAKPGETGRAYWGAPAVSVPRREAPLAIVYLVDTLRADHTTPYGYARDTTPELLAFSKDAVVFEQAIAQASWTKPSVASILTSQLPGIHRAVQLRDPLDSGQLTLAERLQARGFATGAAIANWVIYSEGNNFEQGFDVFTGLHGAGDRPSKLVDAAPVVDAALRWIDSRRGFPTFLYVHTMDPHVPYRPPPPFGARFEPPPASGRDAADPRTDYREPADRDRLVAQYDGEIAYGDQEFGRFVRELKKRGLYDGALVVFLADHGEEFQDHGGWLHGRSVFDELVRIPLVVKLPRGNHAGERVRAQVQSVDVLPTVLQAVGLPAPAPPAIAGQPLQAFLDHEVPERPAVSEISHRGIVAHGIRTGRDKYVRRFSPQDDELYFDLLRDPRELESRLESARDRVRTLKASLEAAMASNPFRYRILVTGPGEYALDLDTGGWIEGVEAGGLGAGERYDVQANGRRLVLRLVPQAGHPREITFGLRPTGVSIRLGGRRSGRPLGAGDVWLGADATHPAAVPFRLPDPDDDGVRTASLFSPPPGARPGVQVWLVKNADRRVLELGNEAQERLRALGYLGPN